MVTLEQIKLLESKISKAINFVAQLTDENNELKKQNEELEETIEALKEEKTRVQEGIVSALGKLNQFEDAIERSISSVKGGSKFPQSSPNAAPAVPQGEPPPVSPAPQPRSAASLRSAEQPAPAAKPQPSLP